MATMDVRNSSSGLLVLWPEPLGEDRWLQPNEEFRIRTDYHGEELPSVGQPFVPVQRRDLYRGRK